MAGAEERPRRGPKPKAESYRRMELYWPDDAMLAELRDEAARRGVSVQSHIRDLLMARHLARHGDSLARLLWVPEAAQEEAAGGASPPSNDAGDAADTAAARALEASVRDDDDAA